MEAVSRLKKLVAAKDAQIEALSSRIEVLTDDLGEARAEVEYAGAAAARAQEAAARIQREADAHYARAQRWESELSHAQKRADDAEQMQVATEESFAIELAHLRAVALQNEGDAAPAIAAAGSTGATATPTTALPAAPRSPLSNVAALEVLCVELRALEEGHAAERLVSALYCGAADAPGSVPTDALAVPSDDRTVCDRCCAALSACCSPCTSGPCESGSPALGVPSPGGVGVHLAGAVAASAKAAAAAALRTENGALKEELQSAIATNEALRADLEGLKEQLIDRTEGRLQALSLWQGPAQGPTQGQPTADGDAARHGDAPQPGAAALRSNGVQPPPPALLSSAGALDELLDASAMDAASAAPAELYDATPRRVGGGWEPLSAGRVSPSGRVSPTIIPPPQLGASGGDAADSCARTLYAGGMLPPDGPHGPPPQQPSAPPYCTPRAAPPGLHSEAWPPGGGMDSPGTMTGRWQREVRARTGAAVGGGGDHPPSARHLCALPPASGAGVAACIGAEEEGYVQAYRRAAAVRSSCRAAAAVPAGGGYKALAAAAAAAATVPSGGQARGAASVRRTWAEGAPSAASALSVRERCAARAAAVRPSNAAATLGAMPASPSRPLPPQPGAWPPSPEVSPARTARQHGGARPRGGSPPERARAHQRGATVADRRVREQIRALLVAKETALDAVAAL